MRNETAPATIAIGVVATLVVVFGIIVPGFAYLTGFTKADGGHVLVVRNGGPFDNNSIQQVIQPNSGITSTGLFSSEHPYPSTQRNFKVSGQANADSNEVIQVPTKDGVLVGVEGTFYFDVNYTDERTLRTFDDRYGTRTYPAADGALSAWEGDGPGDPYEVGYRDGESSGHADWGMALGEVLPDGVETSPMVVADYIEQLQTIAANAANDGQGTR